MGFGSDGAGGPDLFQSALPSSGSFQLVASVLQSIASRSLCAEDPACDDALDGRRELLALSLIWVAFAPIGVAWSSGFLPDLDVPFGLSSNFPFTFPDPFLFWICLPLELLARALPFPLVFALEARALFAKFPFSDVAGILQKRLPVVASAIRCWRVTVSGIPS